MLLVVAKLARNLPTLLFLRQVLRLLLHKMVLNIERIRLQANVAAGKAAQHVFHPRNCSVMGVLSGVLTRA